ncbi:chymotrypsin-1-like [Uranotaenia lowii]|uniref:chymotrypsin-1-like n=1 Tax=Uranotaenia lowii TaxID=190385 RepID=UPI0024793E3D|nr:chymotrypsin-1-like [Uranotaenia lowii]
MSLNIYLISFIIAVSGIARLHGSRIPRLSNHKVVGGHDAKPGEAPFQISLFLGDRFQCGGSIINEHWILTAAHCIEYEDESRMSILAGTNSLSNGEGRRYQVDRHVAHPKYDSPWKHNDIGLIRLKEALEFGELVEPIEINREAIPEGSPVKLSGWGLTDSQAADVPDALQILDLLVSSEGECTVAHEGDSGGPLTFEGKLAGIVSFGAPCAIGYPDVFTRVSFYQDWIEETIANDL